MNYDVQLHIGESRDSGFALDARPGMTLRFALQHRLPATPANGQWPSGPLLCIGAGQHMKLWKAAPQARIPNKSRGRIHA
jgi:hypothetical protein